MEISGENIKKINQTDISEVISQCESWIEKAKSVNIAVAQAIEKDEHATDTYLPCFLVMDDLLVEVEDKIMILQRLVLKKYEE